MFKKIIETTRFKKLQNINLMPLRTLVLSSYSHFSLSKTNFLTENTAKLPLHQYPRYFSAEVGTPDYFKDIISKNKVVIFMKVCRCNVLK